MATATPPRLGVQVAAADGTTDYELALSDIDVTIGEVFDALGLPSAGTRIDGRVPITPDALAVELLSPGSQLSAPGVSAVLPDRGTADPSLVEVSVVAGLDAGTSAQLAAGRYRVGAWYLAIDQPHLAAAQAKPWHEHGPSVEAVAVDHAVLALGRPVDSEPGHAGYVHRPPRPIPPDAVEPIEVIAAPKPVNEPSPLSIATLVAPIPVALLMAFFFRPLFAVFAAMGPIVAFGRWFESRRRFKRDTAKRNEEIAEMHAVIRNELAEQREAEARLRWLTTPHVAELWRRARTRSVRMWERRPGSMNYCYLTVGVGPDSVAPTTDGGKLDDEVHADLRDPLLLRPVPHLVDLAHHTGLGIHGERRETLAIARAAVLQLATLQGPADVTIGLVCPADRMGEWDWLKWLPHLDDKLVAPGAAVIAQHLGPQPGARPLSLTADRDVGPVQLIIVDDPAADVAALHRAAMGADRDVRFIAVAPHPTLLPAVCTSLVGVQGSRAEVSTPELTGRRVVVCPVGVTRPTAAAWARSLAPLHDPEVLEFSAGGDQAVSLLQLVNFSSEHELADRWARRAPDAAPVAAVGVGDAGPFSINMTDDGPHALVAGTTGSGKSEFLRTFVVALATECPPEQLNFVLVDFKGGGAFDICDRLPHIAGLITDLDEAMVVRAINSLRAELHRREHLFRELGVSAYDEAARLSDEPIARLLIVVDEFAALATDYSDLMASIIDLAARGRSLGMHLVLATQRPSGVVDQKIRANTNLRIALRVQDAFDSQDVIGVPDAASIDRKSPGRAIFSVGGDKPVTVQTAYSGAPDIRDLRCSVGPKTLFGEPAGAAKADGTASTSSRTEIDVLIEAIESVAAARSYTPRPLWPEPLPASLDWIDLGTRVLSLGEPPPQGLPLGLVDLPDQQTQLPWCWDPDSGPLVIYGSSAECAGKALVSMGAAFAESGPPDDVHLYLVDGDAGNIASLSGLAHTGAYATINEVDRIERTLRFFEKELGARRTAGNASDRPRLVLMLDNLAAVLGIYDDMAAGSIVDRLGALARDGSPQRVHIVLTARTVRDVSHRLSQQIPNRLMFALADPSGYLTLGLKQREVVDLPEMRAMDLGTKRTIQIVEPPDLVDHVADHEIVAGRMPTPIRSFPTSLSAGELDPASILDDGRLAIPVGIEATDLGAAMLMLQPGEHALVAGPAGAGRSTMLLTIAEKLSATDVPVYRVAPVGSPLVDADVTGTVLDDAGAIQALAESPTGGVLLVDDAGRLDEAVGAAIEALSTTSGSPIRIIAAATLDHARAMRSNVAKIRAGGSGLILGGSVTDGDVLKVKITKLAGLGALAGRGHLVVRGRVQPAHFATPTPNANAPSAPA